MTAKEKLLTLISYNTKNNFGQWANILQDIACDLPSMTEAKWNAIYERMEADVNQSKDGDGMILNGEYYDWRQFETCRDQMLSSWLNYFDEQTIEEIYNGLIIKLSKNIKK